MNARRLIVMGFILMLAVVFTGCKSAADSTIRIGLMPDVNSLPFLIAEQEKLYEREGVKVKLEMFKSASERDAAFQSGNIDGAVSDLVAAAFLANGGFSIAVPSVTDGRYVLLASGKGNAKSVEDLKGKDIAISSNTIIEYVTDEILKQKGIGAAEVKATAIPKIPVRLEMLSSGKVAAACLPDPLATLARETGAVELTDSNKAGLSPSVMVFSRSVTKDKEQMRKLYEAYNDAIALLNTQGDQYRDILVEKAGFPEAVKDTLVFPKYQKARVPKQEEVDSVLNWMREKNLLKKNLSYDDLVVKGLTE